MREIRRLFSGRPRMPRYRPQADAEKVRVTNQLSELELRLAKRYGTTPEALFDYHRADSILGGQK